VENAKCVQNFSQKRLRGRKPLRDIGVARRIIPKTYLEKYGFMVRVTPNWF
jgi:hypothetical protein